MIKVCAIGWYGTETIGDRAILAGIIKIMADDFNGIEISLGSIHPFYSRRTVQEDSSLYGKITSKPFHINLFDVKSIKIIKKEIKKCQLLIMAGGPLMDLPELYMVDFAFKYAKKYKKRTAIYGCGVGPLFDEKYQKVVLDIFQKSDISILRDTQSRNFITKLSKEHNISLELDKIYTAFDPAVICATEYKKAANGKENNDICVMNLRDFPAEYINNGNGARYSKINEIIKRIMTNVSTKFDNVVLVPMHYFWIGNDDREYFFKLLLKNSGFGNFIVQATPLSLEKTMELFYNASFCVGMRFHSVVLQTILNGKNIVIDYTEKGNGKINNFLKDVDKNNFYDYRYINLQETDLTRTINWNKINSSEKFNIDDTYYINGFNTYKKVNSILMI